MEDNNTYLKPPWPIFRPYYKSGNHYLQIFAFSKLVACRLREKQVRGVILGECFASPQNYTPNLSVVNFLSCVLLPHPQPVAAEVDGDVLEERVFLLDLADHGALDEGLAAAQQGQRAAVAARAVDLPAQRAVCPGDLDDLLRVRADQVRVQAAWASVFSIMACPRPAKSPA